ncbi:MAG: lipopolysaccharide biosynthesis protein [Verrucomicrobiota bacterium]
MADSNLPPKSLSTRGGGAKEKLSPGDLWQAAVPAGLRFSGAVLQLITAIIIARTLGATESGIYFFWTAAMMEAGRVATFGLDRIALQQVPRRDHTSGELWRFLALLRSTALLIALPLSAILCFYAFLADGASPQSLFWYVIPPICVIGVTLSLINAETMTGLSRPVLAVLYRHSIVAFVLCPAILLFGERLTAEVAIAIYAAVFFLSGFGALFGPGFPRGGPFLTLPRRQPCKDLLKQGSPIFLSYLFASLAFIIPLIILERTSSEDQIAIVTTSFRIFFLVDVLARAVHSIVMPELSLAAHEKKSGVLRKLYRATVFRGLIIMAGPVVLILIFGQTVMEVFGEDFGSGGIVLQVFMAFALVSLILGPAHQMLLMVGKTGQMAGLSLTQFLFTSILGLIVVPKYGAPGLALVIGLGVVLEKAMYLVASWIGAKKPPHDERVR